MAWGQLQTHTCRSNQTLCPHNDLVHDLRIMVHDHDHASLSNMHTQYFNSRSFPTFLSSLFMALSYLISSYYHRLSLVFYSSVYNTRLVANKRPGWVLEALHEHFPFTTGFLLRDRVVTGGEGGQPSMHGQQHKEYRIKRCCSLKLHQPWPLGGVLILYLTLVE